MKNGLVLFSAFIFPGVVSAAQITGNLRDMGKSVGADVGVVVQCDAESYSGTTDVFGSYSVFVPRQGKCVLSVQYHGQTTTGIDVYSYADPVKYDFDLVRAADGTYSLTRR